MNNPSGTEKAKRAKPDWAAKIADRIVKRHGRDAAETGIERPVVIASGISPSGPIHLGNLRELMVPHFVAEEVKARGLACEHILSWDDYDRLRKVPLGIPSSFEEHIGRPLTDIPDPAGAESSWAESFRAPLRRAMVELGIELREISQTEQYTAGVYRDRIITAFEHRSTIDDVLEKYRTLEASASQRPEGPNGDDDEILMIDGAEDALDQPGGGEFHPYKVYCQACRRDLTEIVRVEPGDGSFVIEYRCTACEHAGSFDLYEENHGKLVWKVDWPMRWAHEGVIFEAGGADHSSPGSSFSVGSELVEVVFGGRAPEYEAYSFVGIEGMGKMSSSLGGVPTPAGALAVLEAPILRWMYGRKTPRQGITVDLGTGIYALYDEWDSLTRKVEAGTAQPSQEVTYNRASRTSIVDRFERPSVIVPFRTLVSAVSVGAGDDTQIARIVGELTGTAPEDVPGTEPRLGFARRWAEELAPEDERIVVRSEPDRERLGSLGENERTWLDLLLARLDDDWTLDGIKDLVYGVPKLAGGLPLDTPPTDELKAEQRAFFKLLYELFLSADTGPRMPTLLLALGRPEVRRLLDA